MVMRRLTEVVRVNWRRTQATFRLRNKEKKDLCGISSGASEQQPWNNEFGRSKLQEVCTWLDEENGVVVRGLTGATDWEKVIGFDCGCP